jgi:hypothetical protein
MVPIRGFLPAKHHFQHLLQPSQRGELFFLSFPSSLLNDNLTSTRARETQAEERLGRYRPPAPSGSPPDDLTSSILSQGDSDSPPPSAYPPGFRRARAGTLPSDVHLAARRFAAASNTLGSTTPSTESFYGATVAAAKCQHASQPCCTPASSSFGDLSFLPL